MALLIAAASLRCATTAGTADAHAPTLTWEQHTLRMPLTVEAHVLDFDVNLYGVLLTLHFVDRLRDEQRFDGVAALVAQLERDRAATEARLPDDLVSAVARPRHAA